MMIVMDRCDFGQLRELWITINKAYIFMSFMVY